jgi:hypothetical protein
MRELLAFDGGLLWRRYAWVQPPPEQKAGDYTIFRAEARALSGSLTLLPACMLRTALAGSLGSGASMHVYAAKRSLRA